MTSEELFRIWDRFDASDAEEILFETADAKLCLRRRTDRESSFGDAGSSGSVTKTASSLKQVSAPKQFSVPAEKEEKGRLVKAPLVGTFYRAPAPGERPFVRIGQKVSKGDTVGIIEAMKMMNEITAPCDGEILEILVEDETLVEYDQSLMRIGEENV